MNYAIEVLRSQKFIHQSALNDLDEMNHLKVTRESIEKKIESINKMLNVKELLVDFLEWYNSSKSDTANTTFAEDADNYLKSI